MTDDAQVSRPLSPRSIAVRPNHKLAAGTVRRWHAVVLWPLVAALTACPSPEIGVDPTLEVSPLSVTLTAGSSQTVNATPGGLGSKSNEVRWSSSNLAIATVSPSSGSQVQVTGVSPGSVTITATLAADSRIFKPISVTVTQPPAALTALDVSPGDFPLFVGAQQQLVSHATPAAASVAVSYAYTSSAITTAAVNATGLVTGVAPGIAVITTAATGSGVAFTTTVLSKNTTVTVSALPASCTALSIDPRNGSIAVGSTLQVNAQATRAAGTVSATYGYNTSNAAIATVNQSGLITAVAPGTATIGVTATCSGTGFANVTLSDQVQLTVTAPDALTALTVTPGTAAVPSNGTVQLTANPAKANANVVVTYVWSSGTTTVANVNQNGLVTAVAAGTSVITVTGTGTLAGFATAQKTATAVITVTQAGAACTAATLTPGSVNLSVGGTTTVTGSATTANGTVSVSNAYSSSANSIASVSAAGVVQGIAPGSATITYSGTCTGSGFATTVVTATSNVTVTPAIAPLISNWSLQRLYGPVIAELLSSGWVVDAQNIFIGGRDNVDASYGGVWQSSDAGNSWSRVLTSTSLVVAVTGTSINNVWALTESGAVYRSTGGAAFAVFRPAQTGDCCWRDILTVGNSVFIVGDNGRIQRSQNGAAFAAMNSGILSSISAIAGNSETNVFAVSDSAASIILKYDGTNWVRQNLSPTNDSRFYDVWVSSTGAVVAAGSDPTQNSGREARLNGTLWVTTPIGNTTRLYSLAGTSLTDLWALDWNNSSQILRNTGATWSYVSALAPFQDLNFVAQSNIPNTALTVGYRQGSVQRYSTSWTALSFAPIMRDVSVATTSAIFAVGDFNQLLRWNGTAWFQWATIPINGQAVWALGTNDALVGGSNLIQRYTNSVLVGQGTLSNASVSDMWGPSSPAVVYVVGSGGAIAKWNINTLTSMVSNTTNDLKAVFGFSDAEIYAGGVGGVLVKYNGTSWSLVPNTPTSNPIYHIWGSSGNDLYVGDDQDNVWRSTNSGATWTSIGPVTGHPYYYAKTSGFSNSATDSYVAGGGIRRYSPTGGFNLMPSIPTTGAYSLATSISGIPGLGIAAAVGFGGAIWIGRSAGSLMAGIFSGSSDLRVSPSIKSSEGPAPIARGVGPRRDALPALQRRGARPR